MANVAVSSLVVTVFPFSTRDNDKLWLGQEVNYFYRDIVLVIGQDPTFRRWGFKIRRHWTPTDQLLNPFKFWTSNDLLVF